MRDTESVSRIPFYPMLTDTHCHLDFHAFDADRGEVLARAAQAGVTRLVNPGCDLPSSRAAVALSHEFPEATAKHPAVFAAVGIHPNDGRSWDGNSRAELKKLAAQPGVVAIGEIGLDYYRDRTPRDLQKRIFVEQLELAAEEGLPVIIHSREALEDTLTILESWLERLGAANPELARRPGVLHSYAGDEATARRAIALGFYIGLTGPVTFTNAPKLQNLAAVLPMESLLVETDAPFLTPHPHRGQRNEPAYVQLTAQKIAALHNQPAGTIVRLTTQNAANLFGKRQPALWRVS